MEVRRHRRNFEVRVQDVARHVVGIRARESESVEAFDRSDRFEQFAERGLAFRSSLAVDVPRKGIGIPKLALRFFSVTVYVLSEQYGLFRSKGDRFPDFVHDFLQRAGSLAPPRMRYDAKGAKIVAARLDDDVRARGIFPDLPHSQVFLPLLVVSDIGSRYDREEFRKMSGLFDSKNEIRFDLAGKKVVIPVEYRLGRGEEGYFPTARFPSHAFFEIGTGESGLSDHASRNSYENVLSEGFREFFDFVGVSEDPVLPLLPYAAGVEYHDVRFRRIEHFSESRL